MMRLAMAGLATVTLLAGCGSGSPLPEAPPCPTPTSTAAPTSTRSATGAYFRGVSTGAAELETSLAAFRATYPDGKFYRSENFRPDFVIYAGDATCRIDVMLQLSPPSTADEGTKTFESELEAILGDYRTQLDRGLRQGRCGGACRGA